MSILDDIHKAKRLLDMYNDRPAAYVVSDKRKKALERELEAMSAKVMGQPIAEMTVLGMKIYSLEGLPDDTGLAFQTDSGACRFMDSVREHQVIGLSPERAVAAVIHLYRESGLMR
jgi:hypothetical protein